MCCFSGPVRSVSGTHIFARLTERGTQMLVYSMAYSSEQPVAMILPLPVVAPTEQSGLRFVSLKAYPEFFEDIEKGFPKPRNRNSVPGARASGMPGATLRVTAVGDFVASFVPHIRDFSRLDSRFRLPNEVWNQIPTYSDYSFAVFQFRQTRAVSHKVHPMVLEFRTRLKDTVYFPTVHIHDGKVHATEHFDHVLYVQDRRLYPVAPGQPAYAQSPKLPLISSIAPAGGFLDPDRAQGVIDKEARCYRLALQGSRPNADTLLRIA